VFSRLPRPVDHLGEALSKRTVVIHVREAEVLVRKIPQFIERLIVGENTASDLSHNAA